jgi:hypothetical protein
MSPVPDADFRHNAAIYKIALACGDCRVQVLDGGRFSPITIQASTAWRASWRMLLSIIFSMTNPLPAKDCSKYLRECLYRPLGDSL